ncbi:MAG: glucose 1-dehydrogenase [Bacillota bacterium]
MSGLQYFDLEGMVAVITGASRGLGRGFAIALAGAGAFAVCVARNETMLVETVSLIEKAGGKASFLTGDFSETGEIKAVIDSIAARYGRIDILVNSAGTEIPKMLQDVTEADYDTIMNTNLKGVYFSCQAAAKHMIVQGGGKIINIGSLASHIGLAKATVYTSSKGGVLQLTKALAVELAQHNIQVNAIGPGYFLTDMTAPFFADPAHRSWIESKIPAGRIGKPEDLAAAAIFLSGSGSDYITGQIIYVDGGWLAG